MKKSVRLFSFDVIRALACVLIIVFHFSIGDRKIFPDGFLLPNFSLGSIGVSLFIILSGAVLSLSDKKTNYFSFLKKRIKAIFPLFYICFIIFFIINFFVSPHLYDNVPVYRSIYTILGLDGLLLYKMDTFYTVGEWYIGCILVLYLVYPFLKKAIDKYPKVTFICLFIFYLLLAHFYPFKLFAERNPLVRLFDFSLGIYYVKYFIKNPISTRKKSVLFFISLIILIITMFIKNHIPITYSITLTGISLFYVVDTLAKYIKFNVVKNGINLISKESYIIFLVHHQIQNMLSNRFGLEVLSKSRFIFVFFIYLVLIIITVIIVRKIYDYISKFINTLTKESE